MAAISAGGIAQIAGAVFTALAACAAWAAVRQSHKDLETRTLPVLQGQPLPAERQFGMVVDVDEEGRQIRHLRFTMFNAGGGPARAAAYLGIYDQTYVAGVVDEGFLLAGWSATQRAGARGDPATVCAVVP
jgi:hypothetical protein